MPMEEPVFYAGIKDSQNTFMGRAEVFERLEADGVERAVVEFSGGHDEGGSDSIRLERDGVQVGSLREHVWPKNGGELEAAQRDEMRLAQSLAAPVYDAFSSFAGDFYVNGEVVWLVPERRVVMEGSETVEHYEGFEREV